LPTMSILHRGNWRSAAGENTVISGFRHREI